MDRAAFLRSLNFLRPLPPGVWDGNTSIDGNNDGEDPYSGSTITPPTPSKNNAIMLFEESPFVASIEPGTCSDGGGNRLREIESGIAVGRKRARGDDAPHTHPGEGYSTTVGPAFFRHHPIEKIAERSDTSADDADEKKQTAAEKLQDAMDVDDHGGIRQQGGDKDDVDGGDATGERFRIINSDPSLCTFEAAIKKMPSALLGDEQQLEGSVFATPDRNGRQGIGQKDPDGVEKSKALIFRFGNRFVFHVDESAILELNYDPGHDRQDSAEGKSKSNIMDGDGMNISPASKRQRSEEPNSRHTDEVSNRIKNVPPCLLISFDSCTFRIFSLEGSNIGPNTTVNPARPSSRIWSTLAAKTDETSESRLMKARSVLLQQFDIKNRGGKRYQHAASSSWKMAAPGSGLSFQSWPELVESPSALSSALKYTDQPFLEEDWPCCLGKKRTVESPPTPSSPQKSSSPSKSGSSSTHFEHGQKEQAPQKNSSSQSHSTTAENGAIGKHDNDEKHDASNHSPELTHESQKNNVEEDVARSSGSQSLFSDDEEAKDKDLDKTNAKEGSPTGPNQPSGNEKKKGEDADTENKTTNQQSLKNKICDKHNLFEISAIHIEKAMEPAAVSSQFQRNLTSSAESLSSSYLTENEFMNASQECEHDIENTTSEMESVLDKMFPARGGRKSHAATDPRQSGDFQGRIEELMKLRREAVAAKLALLMTPKRYIK